jgi:hypothetical protein
MIKFPNRIAVTVDENGDGPITDNLLAWGNATQADDGPVAIYELVEEFQKKDIPHLKRKGTKTWFKARSKA